MSKLEKDIIDMAPDGKQEIVPGSEALKKEPKRKVPLKDRWKKLKKSLDHAQSIMDIGEAIKPDHEESDDEAEHKELTDELHSLMSGPDESEEADKVVPSAPSEDQKEAAKDAAPAPAADSDARNTVQEAAISPPEHASDEELEAALEQAGYTPHEIAYIVRGHHAPELDLHSAAKADSVKAMSDVNADSAQKRAELERDLMQRSSEIKHDHEKKINEHELNHKKRMSDVEYETAKSKSSHHDLDKEHKQKLLEMELEAKKLEVEAKRKQLEIELEFKKLEHDLKLKHMEGKLKKPKEEANE